GVAAGDLADARRRVAEVSAGPDAEPWLPTVVAVRTHAVSSAAFEEDLAALGPRVTTLVLPKVDSAQQIVHARELLERSGRSLLGIVAIIESAAGLENVAAIALSLQGSDRRGASASCGVAFGSEDFAADLG